MSDVRTLTSELEQRVAPPEFELLVGLAARRRRVGRLSLAGAAAVVAAGVAAASMFAPGRATTLPAGPSVHDQQVADILRNPSGELVLEAHAPHEPSVTAELWTRCNGTSSATRERCGSAVRVTAYDLTQTWILPSNDYSQLAFLSDGRFYLEAADGQAQVLDPRQPASVDLTDLRSQAFVPPRTGPATTRCFGGLLCLVDLTARTVAPMAVDSQHWSAWHDSLLWGYADTYTDDTGRAFSFEARWVNADGSRGRHVLVTKSPSRVVLADANPGDTLAYYVVPVDWNKDDLADARSTWTTGSLHLSRDRGATWTVRRVPAAAVDDVVEGLLSDGWASWPQVAP